MFATCTHTSGLLKCQGRNKVCGIRDQRGGIRVHRSKGWDLESQPRDHKPLDQDQHFFLRDWAYHTCGISDQNLSCLWNQGSEIWVQKRDQRQKKHLLL